MKEKDNQSKNFKWKQLFRKKWFFPAIYLIVASLLLTVVIWYQTLDNQITDLANEQEIDNNYLADPNEREEDDAVPVLDPQEVIQMPVASEKDTNIVTKFYEYDAEDKDQENALIYHNNSYYQSRGIDIASEDGETFEVLAALSGTVTNTKDDPLLGKVVTLSHENNVDTYYTSLGDVHVKAGEKVSQGDVIGTAGNSLLRKDHGVHVHFEIRQNEQAVNPESFFNQPLAMLMENTESDESSENNVDHDEEANENNNQANED